MGAGADPWPPTRPCGRRLLLGEGELWEAFDAVLRARPDALPEPGYRGVSCRREGSGKLIATVGGFEADEEVAGVLWQRLGPNVTAGVVPGAEGGSGECNPAHAEAPQGDYLYGRTHALGSEPCCSE